MISANGMVNQMPLTSKNKGNMVIPMMTKTNVLIVEIKTDILPFEKAVNIADATVLIPTVKKLIENKLNPSRVI